MKLIGYRKCVDWAPCFVDSGISPPSFTHSEPAMTPYADTLVHYRHAHADGLRFFYREGGDPPGSRLLLLHGFASSSLQSRNGIPPLARKSPAIPPDLPGFGLTGAPAERAYRYTYDNPAKSLRALIDELALAR